MKKQQPKKHVLTVRVSDTTYKKLEERAEAEQRSMAQIIVRLVEQGLK